MRTVLLIVLIIFLLGAVVPTWPHSKDWGWGPGGGLGLILLVIIVLALMGRL